MSVNPRVRLFPRAALAAALIGVACHQPDDGGQGESTIRGRVTDGNGSQYTRVGGSGSIDAAATVTAYTMADDGSLHAISAGTVEADGSFRFDASAEETRVIVQALSSEGEVVASAILESTGEPGDTVTCTPLDTESSVEAEMLIRMTEEASSVEATNPVDVRVRIDADTAVAVRATFEDGGNAQGETAIDALADAVLAAQATAAAAWSEAGFDTTQDAMFELQMEASQELSQDLYAESSPSGAWEDFSESLAATWQAESGLSETEAAECEAQAGLAFRLVVNGRLGDSDVAWEATQAAAWTEAEAEASAATAIFAGADATGAVVDQCETAGADLVTEVSAAASTTALVNAYSGFETALIGDTSVEGSVLGNHLGLTGATALTAGAALDTCDQSAQTLETSVVTDVNIVLAALGAVDTHAVAAAVVDAWATHRTTVEATIAGASPAIPSEDAELSADIAVLATASFRAVE